MIVLNWNGGQAGVTCLDSVRAGDYPSDVIVIDNGSIDGSGDRIEQAFPEAQLIRNGRNLGFVRGNNVGLAAALQRGADLLFLLNDDTVLEPDCVRRLVEAFERTARLGIAGPVMHRTLQPDRADLGSDFDFWTGEARVRQLGQEGPTDGLVPVDSVWGCALMVRAAVLRRVGTLDEGYIAYFEDADLCLRARADGWQVAAVPSARLTHQMGRSGDRRFLWQTALRIRNHARFFLAHARPIQYPTLVACLLVWRIPGICLQSARVYLARKLKKRYRDRPISLFGPRQLRDSHHEVVTEASRTQPDGGRD